MDKRHVLLPNKTLVMTNLNWEDHGIFQCVAYNFEVISFANGQVKVNSKFDIINIIGYNYFSLINAFYLLHYNLRVSRNPKNQAQDVRRFFFYYE